MVHGFSFSRVIQRRPPFARGSPGVSSCRHPPEPEVPDSVVPQTRGEPFATSARLRIPDPNPRPTHEVVVACGCPGVFGGRLLKSHGATTETAPPVPWLALGVRYEHSARSSWVAATQGWSRLPTVLGSAPSRNASYSGEIGVTRPPGRRLPA